jgi:sodium-coupled neutral amino acid transporter 11
VVVVAVLVVLPLSLVRDISSLASASSVAFLSIVVLVFGVLAEGPTEAHSQGQEFGEEELTVVNKYAFRGIGVLSFHYVCQHSCLLIFNSLDTPSMENVQSVSRVSLGVVLFFSLLLGLGGYVFFGQTIDGNVLNNFHTNSKSRVVIYYISAILSSAHSLYLFLLLLMLIFAAACNVPIL